MELAGLPLTSADNSLTQSGFLPGLGVTGPVDSFDLFSPTTNNYYNFQNLSSDASQTPGQFSGFNADQHALTSQSGCCSGQGEAAASSGFTEPSPFGSTDIQMPGFEGEQKLVNHDGETYIEFYDENGEHIDNMSMDDFEELQQKAADGDQDAIDKLEELGASDELISELEGEESDCSCGEVDEAPPPPENDGCPHVDEDTGLEDVTLDYNEETGEYDLTTIQSFDSMEEALAAYEDADGEVGIRFNEETGKWELQEVESFDSIDEAIEALEDLPEPVDRTNGADGQESSYSYGLTDQQVYAA